MRLAKALQKLRIGLLVGIVYATFASNFLETGQILAIGAWLCFMLLVIIYLFDLVYHRIGARK